jgi:glycine cleavage system H protein
MSLPKNLRYAPTHEWVKVEGAVATVGITDFAVEQLSDLVFIELPQKDAKVKKETRFGEIESTKTVSDLISPVSGKVIEVNTAAVDDMDLIKNSPYEKGWMIKIQMSDAAEVDGLLTADDYQKQLDSEDH